MKRKSTLLQLLVMLFFILVIVGFIPNHNTFGTKAQTIVSPSFNCLGPCASVEPSSGSVSSNPQSVSPAPSIISSKPCDTTDSQAPNRQNSEGQQRGGFLEVLFNLLSQLISTLLGGGSPTAGAPCAPTVAANPSPLITNTEPSVPVVSTTTEKPSVQPSIASKRTTPATATATTSTDTGECSQTAIQKLVASVSQANIETNLKELVQDDSKPKPNELISRHVSSQGNQQKVDWAKKQYTSYGLTLVDQPFSSGGSNLSNVIARVNGTNPNAIYSVGGHLDTMNNYDNAYDSSQPAPGADDNGSSVVTIMEAGRVLKGYAHCMKSSVDFIAFNDEEEEMNGSATYVQSLSGKTFKGAYNLDMVGFAPNGACVKSDIKESARDQVLAQKAVDMNTKYKIGLNITTGTYTQNSGDDLSSFWDKNMPGAYLIECATEQDPTAYQYYHTLNDKSPNVNTAQLAKLAKILVATMAELGSQ